MGEQSTQDKITKLTTENDGIAAIVEIIDVLAKWDDKTKSSVRRWDNVIEFATKAQHLPNEREMWPSELSRQRRITSSRGQDSTKHKYELLRTWFESKYDTGIDTITDRVEESLSKQPLDQSWV